jgi:hypothetical protein
VNISRLVVRLFGFNFVKYYTGSSNLIKFSGPGHRLGLNREKLHLVTQTIMHNCTPIEFCIAKGAISSLLCSVAARAFDRIKLSKTFPGII